MLAAKTVAGSRGSLQAAPVKPSGRTARVRLQRKSLCSRPRQLICRPTAALEIDWSDPDTIVAVLGGVLGLAVGIGAPIFYASRDDKDEKRLEELRELNRQTYKETGQYLTEEEIAAIRQPRWTDRREFVDDD